MSGRLKRRRLDTPHIVLDRTLPPDIGGSSSSFGEEHQMIDHADNIFDLNAVLHPATAFDHPRDVVADATLSTGEKRAILASWASDAAAVTSNPALRELAGTRRVVTIDEVLEALSMLDRHPQGPPGGKPMRMKSTSRVTLAA
jgi:hypothetical protein